MKRAIFAVIIVTLALLVVTCDLLPPPTGALGAVVVDEPGFVTININISDSRERALTKTQAIATVEDTDGFYEVAFIDEGIVYRASWDYSSTTGGSITIPTGNYATVAKAVLFAGTKPDMVLLAIGELSKVNGSTGTNITSTTSEVTFTLSALTSDARTSFAITGPTTPADYSSIPVLDKIISGTVYPVFHIPPNANTTTATYKIASPHWAGVTIGDTTTGAITIEGTTVGGVTAAGTLSGTITGNTNFATPSHADNGKFDITITSNTAGFAKLYFKVPVYAHNSTSGAETWYLQGGLVNSDLDQGTTYANTNETSGGAVYIRVEEFVEIDVDGEGD